VGALALLSALSVCIRGLFSLKCQWNIVCDHHLWSLKGGDYLFGLGVPELILVLVLALIIFGPNKLPEVGSALGRTIKEFKQSTKEVEKEVMEPINETITSQK